MTTTLQDVSRFQKVRLEAVENEDKTGKSGKSYVSSSIRVDGKWYRGFGNDITKAWQPGETVLVEFFTEEYNGKTYHKFRPVSKSLAIAYDLIQAEIGEQKRRIDKISQFLGKQFCL